MYLTDSSSDYLNVPMILNTTLTDFVYKKQMSQVFATFLHYQNCLTDQMKMASMHCITKIKEIMGLLTPYSAKRQLKIVLYVNHVPVCLWMFLF